MFHQSQCCQSHNINFKIMVPTFPLFTFDNKMCAMVPAQKETIQSPQCIPLPHPMILYAQIITKTEKLLLLHQRSYCECDMQTLSIKNFL